MNNQDITYWLEKGIEIGRTDKPMSRSEIAEYLNITEITITKWWAAGKLPRHYIEYTKEGKGKGRPYTFKSEIDKTLKNLVEIS